MVINILREGIFKPVPEEAAICPCCGVTNKFSYTWTTNTRASLQSQCCINMPLPPPLPTFECKACGCIWQWEPDKNETKD